MAQRLEGKLVRAWPLEGGVSARTTAVEVRLPEGGTRTFVVRKHSGHDRAANDLPYWDLYADLRLAPQIHRWGLDEDTTATMRERHETFLADALRQIVRTC